MTVGPALHGSWEGNLWTEEEDEHDQKMVKRNK